MLTATRALSRYLKRRYIGQDNMALKLYSAVSPALNYDSVPGDFTEVANGNGYSTGGKNLEATNFTENVGSGATRFSFGYEQQIWTFAAAGVAIAGYFVTVTCDLGDGSQTYVLWAEPAAFTSTGFDDKYHLTPKVEL
jgi:hypothetical protein